LRAAGHKPKSVSTAGLDLTTCGYAALTVSAQAQPGEREQKKTSPAVQQRTKQRQTSQYVRVQLSALQLRMLNHQLTQPGVSIDGLASERRRAFEMEDHVGSALCQVPGKVSP
jgi:hypothetical protein